MNWVAFLYGWVHRPTVVSSKWNQRVLFKGLLTTVSNRNTKSWSLVLSWNLTNRYSHILSQTQNSQTACRVSFWTYLIVGLLEISWKDTSVQPNNLKCSKKILSCWLYQWNHRSIAIQPALLKGILRVYWMGKRYLARSSHTCTHIAKDGYWVEVHLQTYLIFHFYQVRYMRPFVKSSSAS